MEGIVLIVALIVAYIFYANWLQKGISVRAFKTRLPPEELRQIFQERVSRSGWKIVDDGTPMIAQSSIATGIRQQISLRLGSDDQGLTTVMVGPERWVTKLGVPKKGHTIRIRLNSFVEAVRQRDASINVSLIEH